MRLCINYIFFLLPYLPYALSAPPPPPVTKHVRRSGCQNPDDSDYAFVFFYIEKDRTFDFVIRTQYRTYYPKALESALRLDSFSIGGLTKANACGWQKAHSVYSPSWGFGGRRGDILWKSHSNDVRGREAVSPDHTSSLPGPPPSSDILNNVTRILENNDPAADMYQTSTICLGYACGFLGLYIIFILFRQTIDRKLETPSHDDHAEGIEMETIRPSSTVKLNSISELPSTITIPREARINTREYSRNTELDPPPRYSSGSSLRC
ncbi:hypothetical protein CC86DRAFT_432157 [Ophiobolus disseminans]|uniref:Uncharacterized protein n=1 Tax=Ophiobolus disseminans TaxID=1469910 RepID=A0A6A6ZEL7_9PLEO|nr:hypothetical protein CC86DRAFT_432157 [Ophiobolus disseminans]